MALKQSIKQYRNIKGVKYLCYTSDVSVFEDCKKKAKEKGLKFRIIANQFYLEAK